MSFWTIRHLFGWITLSKFGVDPIFAVGDIAILLFCQFGWKMPIIIIIIIIIIIKQENNEWRIAKVLTEGQLTLFVFLGVEPLKIVGRHQNPR